MIVHSLEHSPTFEWARLVKSSNHAMKILLRRCMAEDSCRREVLDNNVEGVWVTYNSQLVTSNRVVPAVQVTPSSAPRPAAGVPGGSGMDIPIVESNRCIYCLPWKLFK